MALVHYVTNRNPSISDVILVNGAAYDLTGKTIFLHGRKRGSLETFTFTGVATPAVGTSGAVQYDFSAADVVAANEGEWSIWWVVTAAGKTQDSDESTMILRAHVDYGTGAVRTGMADLIGRVRLEINDADPDNRVFRDDEVQAALDDHQVPVRWGILDYKATVASNGQITFDHYYAPVGWWDNDTFLTSATFATVTPSVIDNLRGQWVFPTQQLPPVYITGDYYDLHHAAADLLGRWATKKALKFDFMADGAQYTRSQMQQMLRQARNDQLAQCMGRVGRWSDGSTRPMAGRQVF